MSNVLPLDPDSSSQPGRHSPRVFVEALGWLLIGIVTIFGVIVLAVTLFLGAQAVTGPGGIAGCQPVAPAELPSGAPAGQPTEGVSAGAKLFRYGAGADQVDLLLGLSFQATGDEVFHEVTIRGNPGTVYGIGPAPQSGIGLSWTEPGGCQYTVILDDTFSPDEYAEFALRY